jgi:hypothetical protein
MVKGKMSQVFFTCNEIAQMVVRKREAEFIRISKQRDLEFASLRQQLAAQKGSPPPSTG